MRTIIAGVVLPLIVAAGAFTLVFTVLAPPAPAATASAVRLEAPTRHVSHVAIVKAVKGSKGDRTRVRFNTRSLWSLKPCKSEGSNNCYWDARKQGNGRGTSFAVIKGKVYHR